MKALKVLSLLALMAVLSVSQARAAATSIGVEFLGRDGSGASGPTANNPGTPGVNPNDTAGVVPQQYWNIVNDYSLSGTPEKGETQPLLDNTALTTPVTLSFDCNDSWYNDVTPTNITKPNAHLMNGIIKSTSGGGVPGSFIFNNVPEGQYDLYVYTDMNGDNTIAKFWDRDRLFTYVVKLQHQFLDNSTFIQGTSTDVASATNICNYVKFSNLGTYGSGSIGVYGQWVSGNDGIGIAALQLVNIGPATANTNPVSILTQPIDRRIALGASNVTFSVTTRGPGVTYQWYKGGSLAPGATGSTYTPVPTAADNGAAVYVIAKNNVNSVQSSNAIITVGANVMLPAIDQKVWMGADRAGVEAGSYDTTPPDYETALGAFETLYGNNTVLNWAARLSGIFVAPATTNYTFFVTADDDADLFLSTDPTSANKRLIAQEVSWANALNWLGNDGGTGNRDLQQKRSDQYSPDGGTTVPNANGIHLTAGSQYYIEVVQHQGTGGANAAATYKYVGEPDPASGTGSRLTVPVLGPAVPGLDGAYVVFTTQPAGATIVENHTVTLSVGASSGYAGDASGAQPTLFYQWQSAPSGSTTFVNIAGATGTSYLTPLLYPTNSGVQYRAVVYASNVTTNSTVASVIVLADTNAPVPTVGALNDPTTPGTVNVGVAFDKQVDSASASLLSNYSVSPGTITSIQVLTNRFTANSQNPLVKVVKQSVLLTVTGVTGSGNLTIKNVADLYGNKIGSVTVPFTVPANLSWGVVGANQLGGLNAAVPVAQNGFDLYSDGIAEWATYDEAVFVFEQVTGNFDKRLRVEYQDGSSQWARAGIIVREGTNVFGMDSTIQATEAGRYQKCHVNPVGATLTGPGTAGNAAWEGNRRLDIGSATTATLTGVNAVPQYPNAWCRMTRTNQTFTFYRSNDGINWIFLGATTWGVDDSTKTNMPNTVFVGPEFSPENGNIPQAADQGTFLASIRDYGDTPTSQPPPTLSFKANTDGTLTLTYTGKLYSSTTVDGTYATVTGATSPYVVDPKKVGPTQTFYRAGP